MVMLKDVILPDNPIQEILFFVLISLSGRHIIKMIIKSNALFVNPSVSGMT